TAFVLARERGKTDLRFELGIGPLNVQADPGDGTIGSAEMEQPLPTFEPAPNADPAVLAGLLGLDASDRYFAGSHHAAIYLFTTETVAPEAAAHARMYSLALGASVREDPATGSASGPAGGYWSRATRCCARARSRSG